jgi:glycosyltransferase involved in cell wall biosynthesis
MILDSLGKNYICKIVNLSKKNLKNGFNSFGRLIEILLIFIKVWNYKKGKNLVYISISESFSGNLRDLILYSICYSLRKKTIIHLLGGASMIKILNGDGLISQINKFFISQFAAIIVEGETNFKAFSKVICQEKIHIIPNFAEDFLFVTDEEILHKFLNLEPIKILFLSNLIYGKGHDELAKAYIKLDNEYKKKVCIDFVGGFDSAESESYFLNKIKQYEGLHYLGKFIDGHQKRELFCKSHIFCLPTYYPFEGQPISIIEAYATGCVVVTTNHSGIPSIFSNFKNGFLVEKKSIPSLVQVIEELVKNKNSLINIALQNRDEAIKKYHASIYKDKIFRVFNFFNNIL